VCSFVCCVSFDRGVILCDMCYLFVVSYCKPLPPGKNPFAVNKYYITIKNICLWDDNTPVSNLYYIPYYVDTCISVLVILCRKNCSVYQWLTLQRFRVYAGETICSEVASYIVQGHSLLLFTS
jgi:hypothetical protein